MEILAECLVSVRTCYNQLEILYSQSIFLLAVLNIECSDQIELILTNSVRENLETLKLSREFRVETKSANIQNVWLFISWLINTNNC